MALHTATREPLNRDIIVQHTLTLIEDRGIAGFRLKDLAGRLDVTIPNLYRHFKNRDDIVYSALADDYIAMCAATTERIHEMTSRVTSVSDLLLALRHGDDAPNSARLTRRRTTRLQALAAFERHDRSEEIQSALHSVHRAMEQLFQRAQAVGFIDARYSPQVLTLIASSLLTGIAVTEVDPYLEPAEEDLWDVLGTFLVSLAPSGHAVQ